MGWVVEGCAVQGLGQCRASGERRHHELSRTQERHKKTKRRKWGAVTDHCTLGPREACQWLGLSCLPLEAPKKGGLETMLWSWDRDLTFIQRRSTHLYTSGDWVEDKPALTGTTLATSFLRLIRKLREGGEELSTMTSPTSQAWQGGYRMAAMPFHESSCEISAPQLSWSHSGSTSFFIIFLLPTRPSCPCCFHVTTVTTQNWVPKVGEPGLSTVG